jgi:uncharacterized membrane protein
MRGFLGIVAGLVAVAVTMMLVSLVGSSLVPSVPAINTSSMEAIKETYAGLGTETWLLMLASWFLGSLAGAAVAKKIAGRSWAAWTVAGLILAYLLLTVLMLPMPGWMQVAALAAPVVAGFLANRLIGDRFDEEAETSDETAEDADL